jgi:RHS repeat-associated protein
VSGANYAGVSSYVNTLSYRAFGLKQMTYANGKTLSMQYDNRLRPTQFDIPGVLRLRYEYGWENTSRVGFVRNLDDQTLDRWFAYDQLGRLIVSRSGTEARIAFGEQIPVAYDGPYSQGYSYDVWGNRTHIEGWGGVARWADYTYTNNRRDGMQYDAAGNITADGGYNFSYDATGQQASASNGSYSLQQYYDGDSLRVKKYDNGDTIYYLRSSVLGGQVVAEIYGGGVSYSGSGWWLRGYVYLGNQMLATQAGGVNWVHQDPVSKSQRITDSAGNISQTIELDPFGGDTSRNTGNSAFQPHRFTSYERDGNGADDAMFRRYNRWWATFDQPDPWNGSYELADPQTLNRYAYVQNDSINLVDPTGLGTCRDSQGNTFPCSDEDERWQRETNAPSTATRIFTLDSLFGSYYLPAWMSGHSPMVIGLIATPNTLTGDSPRTVRTQRRQQDETQTPATVQKCPPTPHVSYSIAGGTFLMGGNVSLLASGSGIFLQFGGGTALSSGILRAGTLARAVNGFGGSGSVRVSRDDVTTGWGTNLDLGMYSRSWDTHGNGSNEYGLMIGKPTFNQNVTYTFRIWNVNGCP